MSPSRRRRKTVTADSGPTPPLVPNTEPLRVGEETAAPRRPAAPSKPQRVPFGSYLPAGLQREFKATCVMQGVEMQDGLEEAIRMWLAHQRAS